MNYISLASLYRRVSISNSAEKSRTNLVNLFILSDFTSPAVGRRVNSNTNMISMSLEIFCSGTTFETFSVFG